MKPFIVFFVNISLLGDHVGQCSTLVPYQIMSGTCSREVDCLEVDPVGPPDFSAEGSSNWETLVLDALGYTP